MFTTRGTRTRNITTNVQKAWKANQKQTKTWLGLHKKRPFVAFLYSDSKNESAALRVVVVSHAGSLSSVPRRFLSARPADVLELLWSACSYFRVLSVQRARQPRCCNVNATFPSTWLTTLFPRWFKREQALTGRRQLATTPRHAQIWSFRGDNWRRWREDNRLCC